MARTSYTIRTALNDSRLDLVLNPNNSKDLIQIKKDITVRTLIVTMVGSVIYVYLITGHFFNIAGWLSKILFTISYIWILLNMVNPTRTQLIGFHYVKVIYDYLTSTITRNVYSRSISPIKPIADMLGIKDISIDGQVEYNNGDVGVYLEVVGNGSILMFPEDKTHIIDYTSQYFRQERPDVSYVFDTQTGPQRVDPQLEERKDQREEMFLSNTNLGKIFDTNTTMLKEFVGKRFSTLHQYQLIRAKSEDDLRYSIGLLVQQTNEPAAFVSNFRILDRKEAMDYLLTIYTTKN